ncbi:Major Facilitator Superfamily [Pseudomonas syringae pv. syringae HS191]|nr:Major Facilitator Superfamily [Pseudomonas syringae pv. syringae HS191]
MSDKYAPREWAAHERPTMPGSPSTPLHSTARRWAFAVVGVIVALTGGLGNALVVANLPYLQGALGATSQDIAWLPAAYIMTNVSMNLLLVKFRQQFGLRAFTELFLVLYALVTLAHLFVNDIDSAIAVRAAHGMVGAALSTLGLYYMIQAFPQKWRLKALVLGIGTAQLATPLARLVSEDLLQIAQWRGLYLFELGMALLSLGCVLMLKLPPGDRFKAFEKLDFLTFGLLATGFALFCAVLSLGRIEWWLEAQGIGIASAASIALICAGLAIEHNRSNPLLITRYRAYPQQSVADHALAGQWRDPASGPGGYPFSRGAVRTVGRRCRFSSGAEHGQSAVAHLVSGDVARQRLGAGGQRADHQSCASDQTFADLLGDDGNRCLDGQSFHQPDPPIEHVPQPVSVGVRWHVFPRAYPGAGNQRGVGEPAQHGQLFGVVRDHPEYRRVDRVCCIGHLSSGAREVSFQPRRRTLDPHRPAGSGAAAELQRQLQLGDCRPFVAQQSGYPRDGHGSDPRSQRAGLQRCIHVDRADCRADHDLDFSQGPVAENDHSTSGAGTRCTCCFAHRIQLRR